MALSLDTSRQLRSVSELSDLVKAIATAPSTESEPDWLEWKREADLSERKWHARIAKFIAGFANRNPAVAKLQAGGCGYLILGAEPGSVAGVDPVDNAKLHDGVARFVGTRVRWGPQYVSYQGHQVLVVTIEPPDFGDRIASILTEYTDGSSPECRRGDVFIRRAGKTEQATQDDYDMLVERYGVRDAQTVGVSVEPMEPATAITVACPPEEVDTWRRREERLLLSPLEQWAHREPGRLWPVAFPPEKRSPDEYKSQVAAYLDSVVGLLPGQARARAIEGRSPGLKLVLTNNTEHNFSAVRLELVIKGRLHAFFNPRHALPAMPTRPQRWSPTIELDNPRDVSGILTYGDFAEPSFPRFPLPRIHNSPSTRIEFGDLDLRPGESARLDPLYLVADPELAGLTLMAEWTATSSNTSGIARGRFPISVSTDVVSPLLDPVKK